MGYQPVIHPLLAVNAIAQPCPDLSGITALAFTSANGVTAFATLSPERGLPVFAVGDATAAAARVAGFGDVQSADGALEDLAQLLDRSQIGQGLVLLPGAREPAGDLAALVRGPRIRPFPVYETRETGAIPPKDVSAVLLHSPRAARAFVRTAPGPDAPPLHIALSPAVAEPLAALPGIVHVAAHPTEDALLETLGKALPCV